MLSALKIPLLQAPMVGVSTPALAAAVSNAGGLGGIAIGASKPEAIRQMAAETRALTDQPFNMNIFVVREAAVDDVTLRQSIARLRPWREKFGLSPEPAIPPQWTADFDAQLETLVECRPAVASFTFNCLTEQETERLHRAGIYVIGTATTVAESQLCAARGIDAVCIQGHEAGGHRGSFTVEAQLQGRPMIELLGATLDAVKIPVIAAGGLMNGRDIASVLTRGAAAAQLGTAFLLAPEAATNKPWRARLKTAKAQDTQLTRVFSGRYARGIRNAFMDDLADIEGALPAYPVQNVLTGELRAAAAKAGSADCLSLWAGTQVAQLREMPAEELVKLFWQEIQESLSSRTQ